MTFHSIRSLLAALFVTVLLGGCLGGGDSAPPPTGLTVVPGDGQVTVSWVGDPKVQYWILYAPGNSISTENTNLPAGYNWQLNVTSPYVITGLVNGRTYAFAMNGRTDNGPGGASTASVTAVPRPAGGYWNAGTGSGTNDLKGVTYGTASDASVNYLAVGANSAMYKSLDGVTWNPIGTAPAATNFTAAQNGRGFFLAATDNGTIYRSSDLATWTASATGGTSINAIAASGALAVAVGNGGKIYTSLDAINWTAATSSGTAQNLYGVALSPTGLWLAVGANGTILTSSDGANNWTARTFGTKTLRAVAAQQNGTTFSYVAVGDVGSIWQNADFTGVAKWTDRSTTLPGNFYAITASSVQFLAVGDGGASYVSTNGTTWAPTNTTGGGTGTLSTTASNGKTLYSVINPTFKYVTVGAAGTTLTSQ